MDPQNPKDPKNQTPQLSINNSVPASDHPAADDYLFFNVMPKSRPEDGVIDPIVHTENQTQTEIQPEPSAVTPGNSSKKIWIISAAVAGLLLLAAGGYFAYIKFFTSSEENLLNNADGLKPASQEQSEQPASTTTPVSTKEWQKKYFNSEICSTPSICGEEADPDRDGLTNNEEFSAETDPNNGDSDQEGLSDGDEIKIFNTNPLQSHTANDPKYSDSDHMRGGYDIKTGKLMSSEQIADIVQKMKQFGLHEITIKSLNEALINLYKFTDWNSAPASTSTPAFIQAPPATTSSASALFGYDTSLEAQQDRDTQRSTTIKNIGIALAKYYEDSKTYPKTKDFKEMFTKVKPYIKVASNPEDPINKEQYVYTYASNDNADDFVMSFYSELAKQVIKKRASDAIKDKATEEASIYDDRRKNDLQTLRTALLLYSGKNVAGNQEYVFPTPEKYKTDLVPIYISQIPKDPKTNQDYEYKVSETFDTFTLKVLLDNPSNGTSGFLCNQEECRNY